MKTQQDIEMLFQKLPQVQPSLEFKTTLKYQLEDNTLEQSRPSLLSFFTSLFTRPRTIRFALAMGIVLLILGGLSYKNPNIPGVPFLQIIYPAKVMAAEIIKRSKESFFRPGTIYHQKTIQYLHGGSSIISYDLWRNLDNDYALNHVQYSDGSPELWQQKNNDFRLDIDVKNNVVRKDIFVYDELNKKGQGPKGVQVDLAAYYDDLLQQGVLAATEGTLDGRDVYVVTDSRDTQDRYWDILTFDRTTFQLLQTEKYDGEGSSRTLTNLIKYDIQESLPITQELENKLFTQPPIDLTGYTLLSRPLPMSGGPYEDYKEEILSQKISLPPYTPNKKEYKNTTFNYSLEYPNTWSIEIIKDRQGVPQAVLQPNGQATSSAVLHIAVNSPYSQSGTICADQDCSPISTISGTIDGNSFSADVVKVNGENRFLLGIPNKKVSVPGHSEPLSLNIYASYMNNVDKQDLLTIISSFRY